MSHNSLQKSVTITVLPQNEQNEKLKESLIKKELSKLGISLKNYPSNEIHFQFIKKSIDARHQNVKIHLKYNVFLGEFTNSLYEENLPKWKKVDSKKSVIIIGGGPAGLFGALQLLEKGVKPIIIERGNRTLERKKDIAKISTQDLVNENSNYCFGEGGAGTFSDGKLYTRSNKRGDISKILKIFVEFGADKKILTDSHPHIGTDKLPQVIRNLDEKIIELGGEIHFNQKCVDFLTESIDSSQKQIKGIISENTISGEKTEILSDFVVLATGHSASDIYKLLAKISPNSLEAKTFAVGVRVEHPRSLIDQIQYHGKNCENLGAAEYRVTTQIEGRGVYSFCMCPGGFVVPSASGQNEIVVNGMSSAKRNSEWSNAAIVVEIRPEDIPNEFLIKAQDENCPHLAGLFFREQIEQSAKQNGKGQAAPSQLLKDFLENQKSQELPQSSYTPGIVSSNLCEWMPKIIYEKLQKGFIEINKNMKGFICDQALLIAPETRTSTPVRILRDKENLENLQILGLFPCGEGSGYSGGIVSSAMDGEKVCKKILEKLK